MISLRPLLRRSLLSAFVQRASFSTVDGGAGGGGGDKSGGHGRFHVSGSGFWRGSDVQGRGGDHPRQHGGSQHQHQGGAGGGAGGGAARRPFGGGNNSNSNFSGRNNNFSNNNRDGGGFQHRERLPLGDIRTTADNMMVITRDSGRPLPLQVRKQMTQVRLISPDGKNEGIVDLRVASQAARHHGGVLVLMTRADGNTPSAAGGAGAGGEDALPVLRIRSAEQIAQLEKEKEEQRKVDANTKKVVVKEIRLTTRTEDHDIGVKAGQLLRFLEKNHPVRIFVRLKNNEMQTGEEHAKESIQKVLDAAKDKFVVHRPMRRMGIHVDTTVTPLALAAAQAEAKK